MGRVAVTGQAPTRLQWACQESRRVPLWQEKRRTGFPRQAGRRWHMPKEPIVARAESPLSLRLPDASRDHWNPTDIFLAVPANGHGFLGGTLGAPRRALRTSIRQGERARSGSALDRWRHGRRMRAMGRPFGRRRRSALPASSHRLRGWSGLDHCASRIAAVGATPWGRGATRIAK